MKIFFRPIQTCTDGDSGFKAKDHSNFIMTLMVYVGLLAAVFILFLRTEYKRRRADRGKWEDQESSLSEKNSGGGEARERNGL